MNYCTYDQYAAAGGTLDEAAFAVSSVSNDGVSMTFTSGALAERLAAEAAYILANTLGSDPHNLLYRRCF